MTWYRGEGDTVRCFVEVRRALDSPDGDFCTRMLHRQLVTLDTLEHVTDARQTWPNSTKSAPARLPRRLRRTFPAHPPTTEAPVGHLWASMLHDVPVYLLNISTSSDPSRPRLACIGKYASHPLRHALFQQCLRRVRPQGALDFPGERS